MLQHIALTVNDLKEIENFFENILLFTIKHKFSMIDAVSKQILSPLRKGTFYRFKD